MARFAAAGVGYGLADPRGIQRTLARALTLVRDELDFLSAEDNSWLPGKTIERARLFSEK